MPPPSTQSWLRENARFYSNSHAVYAHADALLARFPPIRPKTDVYTYDDGRSQLLLCFHGTLPITYRQATYNIPVAIWLTRDYPKEHPIPYVVATPDMLIRSSQYIDLSGRCNIEYIQNWQRKSEGCSLIGLVEAMQEHFSKEPPVYAKPKDHPSPKPSSSPNRYSARPPPPLPGTQPQQLQQPGPSQNAPVLSTPSPPQLAALPTTDQSGRPALPPKPGTSLSRPITASPPQIQQPALPQTWDPPRHTPSPPSHHPLPTHYQSMQVPENPTSSQPGYYASHPPPPPPPPPSLTSPITTPPPPPSLYPSLAQIQQQITRPIPPPPPPPVHPAPSQIYPQLHNLMNQNIAHSPPPNLMDEDDAVLERAVQPPPPVHAPPRPPNPELLQLHSQIQDKLGSEFASLSQAMALDAERLRTHQADLLTGEPAIRDEMARLEAVRDVCRGVSSRLRNVVTQGEANINDLRNKGDPPVDELLCSTTIVHNQLIDLIAEDNAIEDTMYHLHRALNAGRIDLERFLRTTRTLAEEQFMKRALIEKIQLQAPIGGWA